MIKHAAAGMGILILVLILAACPAQAFTAKTLEITVQDSGAAAIDFAYELSWIENVVVFSRIVDPAGELAKALRAQSYNNVVVTSVSGTRAGVLVKDFASREGQGTAVTLTTPPLAFIRARDELEKYWFARFVSADFSPEVTRIRFPDGYTAEFYNQEQIPSVSHVIGTP